MNDELTAKKDSDASTLIVAEGDSWFHLPCKTHVLDHLKSSKHRYKIESIAHYKHTLNSMVTKQKYQFKNVLRKISDSERLPKAILLSAGGNDFVNRFADILNEADQGLPTINDIKVNNFLDRLQFDYLTWLNFITDTCNKTFQIDNPIPILIHGYAYAVPSGRKYKCFPFSTGPWLKEVFDMEGYSNLTENTETMVTLVDMLNDVISELPNNPNLNHVHYVDLRDVLSNDLNNYKDDWEDELHPTKKGFEKVAQKFADKINAF